MGEWGLKFCYEAFRKIKGKWDFIPVRVLVRLTFVYFALFDCVLGFFFPLRFRHLLVQSEQRKYQKKV